MINNPVIFYTASVLLTGFALGVLFARNIIYSLLCSVMVFFSGAILFYLLGSEYNAIIQTAIYGLAVPVIIGISIMFTQEGSKYKRTKSRKVPYLTLMCAGIFILAFIYLVMMSLIIAPDTFHIMESVQTTSVDNINAFARGIFIDYVWAFELVSLLLTIMIAGIGMLKRSE